ncbi:TPA: hypothetical protein DDW35_06255, partial [Candidatus Sumerlaeota bacterium]|nr:hypothetical protein [Candidatus Sumerlaeota bacterium]
MRALIFKKNLAFHPTIELLYRLVGFKPTRRYSGRKGGNSVARPDSKEAILDAAESVVLEHGASHMTLDAVAERAGVSKGGLMYNFPTKEALLTAMITRLGTEGDKLREQERAKFPAGQGDELFVEISN